MALELKIVSKHAEIVGDDYVRKFNEGGGTIGRSLRSDWILPDPDRFISSQHATIDFQSGAYYLADTSSNGVFINDEKKPIGKGNPRRLFDGDRLRMGGFEISVSIDSGESLVVPLDDDPAAAASGHMEQLVDEDMMQTGMDMLEAEAITGEREFHSTLFGDGKDGEAAVSAQDLPDNLPVLQPESNSPDKAVDVTAEDLFDSFLDGLGINRVELHPSVNRPEMLLTAGQVLRQFVEGTTRMLANRAGLKNTFRLDQTTVMPRNNNPMKFSENTNDLLKQLLTGNDGEYLGAQESVREVCRDLINHQNAFLDAMAGAFVEFADRFDPVELQQEFDDMIGSRLFRFMNKSKYWHLYSELYPAVTEKGGGRFPQMFSEEFVKAYERQVAEYRHSDIEATGHKPIPSQPGPISVDDPDGMAATQILPEEDDDIDPIAPAAPVESAFEDDDIVDALTAAGSCELDQSLIDELENSLAENSPKKSA